MSSLQRWLLFAIQRIKFQQGLLGLSARQIWSGLRAKLLHALQSGHILCCDKRNSLHGLSRRELHQFSRGYCLWRLPAGFIFVCWGIALCRVPSAFIFCSPECGAAFLCVQRRIRRQQRQHV
jgi:hypothetical protein